MDRALELARQARGAGEVPVGAVVVHAGRVVGEGCNGPIAGNDPTAHAEVRALRAAAQTLENYRLEDCTLYVTLEPCPMCAGAILHSRIRRVVYGSSDPKTGAAGSVLNLFAFPVLNHQTTVESGVRSEECGALLQDFFAARRQENRLSAQPLRDDALRTPAQRFENLSDYPWTPRWLQQELPALAGLRMACLDEGPRDAACTYLCLHGNPAWSYLYRKMIPVWTAAGCRVVAPDLIGFGQSDKPKRVLAHNFDFHRQVLLELVEHLDLQRVVLVVQDWGGILGLTLPMEQPWRYQGLLAMNTLLATGEQPLPEGFLAWRAMCAQKPDYDIARLFKRGNPHLTGSECEAYNAPFPDNGHRAAVRAFPAMVPASPSDPGAEVSRQAERFWREDWKGRTLLAVGAQDPVLGLEVMDGLRQCIRQCPEPLVMTQAGHFVQEHGQTIAQKALELWPAG